MSQKTHYLAGGSSSGSYDHESVYNAAIHDLQGMRDAGQLSSGDFDLITSTTNQPGPYFQCGSERKPHKRFSGTTSCEARKLLRGRLHGGPVLPTVYGCGRPHQRQYRNSYINTIASNYIDASDLIFSCFTGRSEELQLITDALGSQICRVPARYAIWRVHALGKS